MNRRAFTLVELLVSITIIGILAGLMLGAYSAASNSAKEYATKATIAKLNAVIMRQYESYLTRRVPVSTSGLPPKVAAEYRLWVLRDLMRMEMPDAFSDLNMGVAASATRTAWPDTSGVDSPDNIPLELDDATIRGFSWPTIPPNGDRIAAPSFSTSGDSWVVEIARRIADPPGTPPTYCYLPRKPSAKSATGTSGTPALARLYWQALHNGPAPSDDYSPAQCLYMIVSLGSPEAMEQFNQSEIGMIGNRPVFVDGWGKPIMFLRWAPGASTWTRDVDASGSIIPWPFTPPSPAGFSQLQTGSPLSDHDPFDSRNVHVSAFRLVPLIYSSAGRDKHGINLAAEYVYGGDPFADLTLGQPIAGEGAEGNITNHAIEQR